MSARLDILGCGRLGRTLGRLFAQRGDVEIGAIASRTPESARDAVAFVGAGHAVAGPAQMGPADLTLIAAPDDAIEVCCEALARERPALRDTIVFHCSGSLSSDVLRAARQRGAHVASVHPVHSFADPAAACGRFEGTFCGCEGDEAALRRLGPLFESIGGRRFAVEAESKAVYHAGTVIACNYLVALVEAGLACFEYAGVERPLASCILAPLVAGTVENVFDQGPVDALTGPIARGEPALIDRQLDALEQADPRLSELYRVLGRATLELARSQGRASADALRAIEALLERVPSRESR